jgi:ABC-type Fe3+/spermidine/putrescine transport system ATPase subunit
VNPAVLLSLANATRRRRHDDHESPSLSDYAKARRALARAGITSPLLLEDPVRDTWDPARVGELRRELGRRATELGLPAVSVTLVPVSEADLVEVGC